MRTDHFQKNQGCGVGKTILPAFWKGFMKPLSITGAPTR